MAEGGNGGFDGGEGSGEGFSGSDTGQSSGIEGNEEALDVNNNIETQNQEPVINDDLDLESDETVVVDDQQFNEDTKGPSEELLQTAKSVEESLEEGAKQSLEHVNAMVDKARANLELPEREKGIDEIARDVNKFSDSVQESAEASKVHLDNRVAEVRDNINQILNQTENSHLNENPPSIQEPAINDAKEAQEVVLERDTNSQDVTQQEQVTISSDQAKVEALNLDQQKAEANLAAVREISKPNQVPDKKLEFEAKNVIEEDKSKEARNRLDMIQNDDIKGLKNLVAANIEKIIETDEKEAASNLDSARKDLEVKETGGLEVRKAR